MKRLYAYAAFFCIVFAQCKKADDNMLFERIDADESGVTFENTITENDSFNVLKFEYIYNGGGVGIGDFNNDGAPDIFFAGNAVSSKLYLNQGNFKFKDVTLAARVATTRWCTGVAVQDFNEDGLDDIYVCTASPDIDKISDNFLFINKGNVDGVPVFEDMAQSAGLLGHAYSTQASFLDYDLDGDLDMYLVINALENYPKNNPVGQNTDGRGKSQDKFFRNDSDSTGVHFTDISSAAGIQTEGWGLGIVINDFNADGYPDIYVTNDFLSNDHLYINNHDGTFTNRIDSYFTHTEFNGMGVDAADINNDGLNDLIAVDMMPDDNLRQKAMFSNIGYSKFQLNAKQHYLPQYFRNVLQLNNGNNSFSDIGCLSGIYATDWSWSALIADFNNDGWRDVLITNGYLRDVTDLDFISYNASNGYFGKTEDRRKKVAGALQSLNGVHKPNFIFKNDKDLTFSDKTNEWGMDIPSYTNGAAYADLDNDGDLDLVMNNINSKAFIYRNRSCEQKPGASNYIKIEFAGSAKNRKGIGCKVWVYNNNGVQYAEHSMQRGYKSSVDQIIHFGLGDGKQIDSIKVLWPLGVSQIIEHPEINKKLLVRESNATLHKTSQPVSSPIFNEVAFKNITYKHTDVDFIDFKQSQSTLLHKFSQSGPAVTVGDVNNDGREDFVVGGSSNVGASIFIQTPKGQFDERVMDPKAEEDAGILLVDIDNDHDLDLFCATGGSEYGESAINYKPRLYYNNSKGEFSLDVNAIPASVAGSGSTVAACDYDHDGDVDLFVGGRVIPNQYPLTPTSYLLQNEGNLYSTKKSKNQFKQVDVDSLSAGMITNGIWVDFDGDTYEDLVVVGEWMPITFFKNDEGHIKKLNSNESKLPKKTGWWRCIKSADFDKDGDNDFIVGNFGLNSIYQATDKQPITLYYNDFDKNGTVDPFVCRYILGKEYPVHPRETMTEQMVPLKKVLTSYAKYGTSTIHDIFSEQQLDNVKSLQANYMYSSYVENLGNGNFSCKPLPMLSQTSTINDMVIEDFDHDGNLDVLAVQNDFSFEPLGGHYDAGTGVLLKGDGKGNFRNVPINQSGFAVRGDAKAIAKIKVVHDDLYVISQNRDSLKFFKQVKKFNK